MQMRPPRCGLFIALLLGAYQSAADGTPASAASAPTEPTPASIWAGSCSYCHERGIAAPVFGRHLQPSAIGAVVRNGLGSMPAYHPSEISDAALEKLAIWVARQPPAAPSKPASSVH